MTWHPGPVIARGRRSAVYLARDARSGESIAVKVARGAAFAREHEIAAMLPAANAIRVHGHGKSAEGAWLAMEYATGGAVPATQVEPERALAMLSGAANALAALHAAGWVHRDVKPANLLVRCDGSVALTDFGSACRIGEAARQAGEWTITGTPRYCAPEQARGDAAQPAADVYSLGVMLHEWLTGTAPFAGETVAEVLAQHLFAPVPVLPAAFAAWQPLLGAMLAKDAGARCADGAALLVRLKETGMAP